MSTSTDNRVPRLITHCSFCNNQHSIRRCDDERIIQFENLCINYINEIGIGTFRQFLLDYAVNGSHMVRCLALKKRQARLGDNIVICVDRLVEYFHELIGVNNHIPTENTVINNLMMRSLLNLSQSRAIQEIQLMEFMLVMRSLSQLGSYDETFANPKKKFNVEINVTKQCGENLEETCECNICYENYDMKEFISLNCGHEFCKECIKNSLKNEKKMMPSCAMCRADIKSFKIREESIKNEFSDLLYGNQ